MSYHVAVCAAAILAVGGFAVAAIEPSTPPHQVAPVPAVVGSYQGCADCSEQAKQIAWSLDHQPSEWNPSMERILCRGNVCLWLDLNSRFVRVARTVDELLSQQGAASWIPSDQDKDLIWNAYQRWIAVLTQAMQPKELQASDIHP